VRRSVRRADIIFPCLPIILPTSSGATLRVKVPAEDKISRSLGTESSGVIRNLRYSSIDRVSVFLEVGGFFPSAGHREKSTF